MKTDFINSIKSGKKDVLLDVYKRYRNDFVRWAVTNYNVSIEEAKDVFQDIIISLYQNVMDGKLTELNCELRTFLYQIGKFKLLNLKKREQHKTLYEEDFLYKTQIGVDTFFDTEEEKYINHKLTNYLTHLCENCRTLIDLFYIKELPLKKIAKVMGYKSEDVAKKKRYECFKKLTVIYQKEKQSGAHR